MFKKIFLGFVSLVFILILTVVGLALTVNLWLGSALAFGIGQVTGVPVKIDRVKLNLLESRIEINGIKIKNPKDFPDSLLASVPEIYVDFDLDPFLKNQRLYFQEIRLNIEEVGIIKNKAGETNISKLKPVSKPKEEMAKEQEKVEKAKSPQALKFFVEKLVLTVRQVKYQDQQNPLIGSKTIDLHLENEEFKGITSPMDIVRIVVLQITYKAALGNLGVPVDMLKGHLDQSLALGEKLALQATTQASQMTEQALGEGARLIQDAAQKVPVPTEEMNKAVGEVSNKAKSFFGSATQLLGGSDSKQDTTQSS